MTLLDQLSLFYESDGVTWYGSPVVSDSFISYVADNLAAGGVISAELASEIDVINAMVVEANPSAEILAYVTGDFVERSWSSKDRPSVDLFVDVFVHSFLYWHVRPGAGEEEEDDNTDEVIIADAVGALYGLLCGPFAAVWSPVEGAVFSIIANNASPVAPMPTVVYHGLIHSALGAATLDVRHDRVEAYRYDGPLDGDGVSVDFGPSESISFSLRIPDPAPIAAQIAPKLASPPPRSRPFRFLTRA